MESQPTSRLLAGQKAATLAQWYATACLIGSLAAVPFVDGLTSVLLLLNTFLFWVVVRYSRRYLMGDPGQARFFQWLCLTATFVMALVLAKNLLVFAACWCGISLSLHQLLQFYKTRPDARLAARKKFMISRLGDVTLAAALVLTYQTFGTWSLDGIFAGAVRMREAGPAAQPEAVGWICGLLVFAALLKSAQFPFHSWLPDTMETPTPVSALMHAGVINAGGMLIIRFRDLITLSDGAMLMLCIIGGFTALFASAVMLTQASVKRCLAFSTVAQMGFMMFECGAGAFHLALLHLVAHSLYKAHAFLSAGGAVSAGSMPRYKAGNLAWLALCLIAAVAVTFGTAVTLGVPLETQGAFHLIFAVGLAQMFWNFPPVLPKLYRVPLALACAVVAAEVYFRLEKFAQTIAGPSASDATWAAYTVAAFFLIAAIAQNQLPRIATSKLAYAIYVHARSGFYINTLANRLTLAVWPSQLPKERVKWLQAWS